ncbi:MAG: FAD-linked oxidase C-terminal domain-containing protein [Candidatus Hydrogenedentes bacterium]|nr:FAD-linked oxidase C-terminal domain-containing protein [Candidatus Hydrogenedentota bacterium]
MNATAIRQFTRAAACDVRTDDLTRQLYATDASLYEIAPDAVAFPRDASEASRIVCAAGEAGLPVIPRGAGTGLSGGALGRGVVVDFSRYNRAIEDLDLERRTVRVGAGVVLDQLNARVKPHGLWFGPDVATSARATLGGMIANNSSGAHVPVYGTTAAHVRALELVMSDGRIETIGPGYETLGELRRAVDAAIQQHANTIRERFPDTLNKRWPGYGLDLYLRSQTDLTKVLAGSEGTLAMIASAELALNPMPVHKGLCLICVNSIPDAAHATLDILDLKPAAIELIDDILWESTRGQLAFVETRELLGLDSAPCKAILIVEFFEDVEDRIEELAKRDIGVRKIIVKAPREMEMVWTLRKAGLSLLTGCKGAAKPVPGIEDVAVPPHKLPEYVNGLLSIFAKRGLEGSFYGHAAAGLLHVRPVLDLHRAEDVERYRQISDDVSALVREVKGSISAEHGVGIGHTEYMPEHMGAEIMDLTRTIKALFDPKNVFNPGKIVPGQEDYRIETNLRQGPGRTIPLPFEPVLAFAAKDESFIGNLEQCNGCGGCRKAAPTMCPTYPVTGDEIMSTRGRANTIRAVLEQRILEDPLTSASLELALGSCLSCKACTTECPSNVNMALLKAELLHARHRRDGVPLRDRVISNVDLMGRMATIAPRLANAMMKWSPLRTLSAKTLGFAPQRPFPPYGPFRFDRWFARHAPAKTPTRGRVILWDDTFVRYHEPAIGVSAVAVLEAAGFEVALASNRVCCGRPAFSVGCLDTARANGVHNIALLRDSDDPIVFLEPSCYSMFAEDYIELKVPGARDVAKRCKLFEQFLYDLLEREPHALEFDPGFAWVAIHAHCHAKALTNTSIMKKLCDRLPNATVTMLNTGCCGMAGAFGQMASKYDLSLAVAQPLVDQINALAAGTEVVASGTSCRHQIDHLTDVTPIHMAELIANALARGA